jgi:phosphate transporter
VERRGPNVDLKKKANERTRCAVICLVALGVFAVLLRVDVFSGERSKNMCLAMLALLSILWSTEAIPLYVTSMLVPALTVVLQILPAKDGSPMKAPDAAKRVFEASILSSFCILLAI